MITKSTTYNKQRISHSHFRSKNINRVSKSQSRIAAVAKLKQVFLSIFPLKQKRE